MGKSWLLVRGSNVCSTRTKRVGEGIDASDGSMLPTTCVVPEIWFRKSHLSNRTTHNGHFLIAIKIQIARSAHAHAHAHVQNPTSVESLSLSLSLQQWRSNFGPSGQSGCWPLFSFLSAFPSWGQGGFHLGKARACRWNGGKAGFQNAPTLEPAPRRSEKGKRAKQACFFAHVSASLTRT